MAKVIHKYHIGTGRTIVSLPVGARVINAGIQTQRLALWALVDAKAAAYEPRAFNVYMTGEPMPDEPGTYLKTVINSTGIVAHVFESALGVEDER